MRNKKASLELSINSIVFLILALLILSLGLNFIRGGFGKTALNLEQKVSEEPEPIVPTASKPITLSRNLIKTAQGGIETIKIGIFNPTSEDWLFRDYLSLDPNSPCTRDSICYQSSTCTNDIDCNSIPPPLCGDDGRCLITEDRTCPKGGDRDCAPTEGVYLLIECANELDLKIETSRKTILVNEYRTFTALLRIREGLRKGKYLCRISIKGGNIEGSYSEDLVIQI